MRTATTEEWQRHTVQAKEIIASIHWAIYLIFLLYKMIETH